VGLQERKPYMNNPEMRYAGMADLAPESNEPILEKPAFKKNKSNHGSGWIIIVLIIIIIAAVVLFYLDSTGKVNLLSGKTNNEVAADFDSASWKAVFLTNGQVYFGHLKGVGLAYPELSDIYYLQVQKVPIQPAQAANNQAGVQDAQQTQDQLIMVKFGTELHKPMDKMFINKDHIMFYEDLAADSAVVKAIEDYIKAQAEKPAAQPVR